VKISSRHLPGEADGKPGTTVHVVYAGVSDIFIIYDTLRLCSDVKRLECFEKCILPRAKSQTYEFTKKQTLLNFILLTCAPPSVRIQN
jgi:hypothetical protein